ncbi:MAG: hypothetical protein ABIK62_00110 [candidate division WOR-3 bacterium]
MTRAGIWLGLSVAILCFCAPRAVITEQTPRVIAEVLDSMTLSSPAAAMCRDQDGLLLIDRAGTELRNIDFALQLRKVTALPAPISDVQGITADQFFCYFWDRSTIQRLDRISNTLEQVASEVQCLDATLLPSGDLVYIDASSRRPVLLTFARTRSTITIQSEDQAVSCQAQALAYGPDGRIRVLSSLPNELLIVDLVGTMVRRQSVPEPGTKIFLDDSLRAFVIERTGSHIWRISQVGPAALLDTKTLGTSSYVTSAVAVRDWLFLLDQGRRLLKLRIRATTR